MTKHTKALELANQLITILKQIDAESRIGSDHMEEPLMYLVDQIIPEIQLHQSRSEELTGGGFNTATGLSDQDMRAWQNGRVL